MVDIFYQLLIGIPIDLYNFIAQHSPLYLMIPTKTTETTLKNISLYAGLVRNKMAGVWSTTLLDLVWRVVACGKIRTPCYV